MAKREVSVIITTRNEETNIANCLESIKEQVYPKGGLETIVVDNNSEDRTVEIAKKYTDRVYNYGPERSSQRNFGVKNAYGRYILYLDADMKLSPGVIKECISKCTNGNYVALYVPERVIGEGFWAKARDFERSFYDATCIDAVRFARRDKVLEIKGFDESLNGPEDWDFDRRIKDIGEVDIIDAPIYHNEGRFEFKDYLKKKVYYAKSFEAYIQKWGKCDPIIKKQLGFWYRYIGVFIEEGKWKRLLMHPVLSLGLYFIRAGVGLCYLFHKLVKSNE